MTYRLIEVDTPKGDRSQWVEVIDEGPFSGSILLYDPHTMSLRVFDSVDEMVEDRDHWRDVAANGGTYGYKGAALEEMLAYRRAMAHWWGMAVLFVREEMDV